MMDISNMHPQVRALYEYWRRIHPPTGLPGRQHFDPDEVIALLPNIRLVEAQLQPFRLRYRLVGSRVDTVLGHALARRWLDDVYDGHPNWPELLEDYRRVVSAGVPSWRRGVPRVVPVESCASLETLRLPLAAHGQIVDMVLGVTLYFDAKGQELQPHPMAPRP
jgi:hypothetical protein